MASRVQQDTFMDDSDDAWSVTNPLKRATGDQPSELVADRLNSPLCVEEFDLSDKNFRPCPCGYQVLLSSLLHQEHRYFVNIETTTGQESHCTEVSSLLGMPVLLQQHQEQYERSLPRLPETLRR